MGSIEEPSAITIGVLALQGAFNEHVQLLQEAAQILATKDIIQRTWTFKEIRNKPELDSCDALIIPGGESTAISLVAQRCNMLEPLRDFVK
jgi:5'-phosphate synthase pdxT subunit